MKLITLSLRYHAAQEAKAFLKALPGDGTAYLTDRLYEFLPGGGREWLYPDGPQGWEELARPGDLVAAAVAAKGGADILYRYPSTKRRRLFVRWPGSEPRPARRPFTRKESACP